MMRAEQQDAEDVVEGVEESWQDLPADLADDLVCGECNEGDEVIQDDSGERSQVPRGLPEPKPPSAEAQRRHNLTHWPYANWCPHCIMGSRNNTPHPQSRNGEDRLVPLLVLDYCFIRNAQDQDLVTLLVGKLYPCRRTFACVVDMKGVDGYAIARLAEFIKGSGLTKFVYKTDQENAIKALSEQSVKEADALDASIKSIMEEAIKRSGRSGSHIPHSTPVPEWSAVGESASNGRAERTVQMVENIVRTGKSALESRLGAKIPCSHPVVNWMVEHYTDVMNKYAINKSGMSAYEELHGRKAAERRMEFGERVFYSTPKKGRAKLDLRWKIGIYLGHLFNSNEICIGTKSGNVIRTRSAVRVVEGSRWNLAAIENIIGTPADMTPVDENGLDADDIEGTSDPHDYAPADVDPDHTAAADAGPDQADRRPPLQVPKRIKITTQDCNRYGFTRNCLRCADLENGNYKSKRGHNEECRQRMYAKFQEANDPKWAQVSKESEPAQASAAPAPSSPRAEARHRFIPTSAAEVDLDAADVEQPPAKKSRLNADEDEDHVADLFGNFDESDGEASEPEAKRSRSSELGPEVIVGDDDDSEHAEENQYRGTLNALVSAGVDKVNAVNKVRAIVKATFKEMYGRGSINAEANGPR